MHEHFPCFFFFVFFAVESVNQLTCGTICSKKSILLSELYKLDLTLPFGHCELLLLSIFV